MIPDFCRLISRVLARHHSSATRSALVVCAIPYARNTMSSAYASTCTPVSLSVVMRGFMYILKRIGDRHPPCGTPFLIFFRPIWNLALFM